MKTLTIESVMAEVEQAFEDEVFSEAHMEVEGLFHTVVGKEKFLEALKTALTKLQK